MKNNIVIRQPESIYQAHGTIQNGTFHGRWHFSFDQYHDPEYIHFGTLRVFNDDTLSLGAVWPLHKHRDIEVVTYCAEGEFRHEDEHGKGGILKKGWVQHTTVGSGMWHSEINHRSDAPMRFIQMWFFPSKRNLRPSVEQKAVEKADRTNRFLPLVSNDHPEALKIFSDVQVYSCFIQKGHAVDYSLKDKRGGYLYVVEGSPVQVNGYSVPFLGAAKITGKIELSLSAEKDAELLFVDVVL
jgi:redox-sensitive bicupin YhaK (pirin superfamily)